MRKSKLTDSQDMVAVKRVGGGARHSSEVDISAATHYKWRAKYGDMEESMMDRMNELEDENRRFKKMNLDEKLKAEIVAEALEKRGEAI